MGLLYLYLYLFSDIKELHSFKFVVKLSTYYLHSFIHSFISRSINLIQMWK